MAVGSRPLETAVVVSTVTPEPLTAPAAAAPALDQTPEPTAHDSSGPRHVTAPEDRVLLPEKLALGAGGVTMFFGNVGVKSIAAPVYQMTLGINPALLGLMMAIPRLWDAITDPVMGNVSDNFRSRWGRRRPFIALGAVLMGLSFGLIWMVPEHWSETAILTYFVVTSLLFYTCFTIFAVPFNSLTYEMTPDYHERTRVMAYPTFFSKVAEAGYFWVIPLAGMVAAWMDSASILPGVRVVGWGVGFVIMALIGVLPALLVKERFARKIEARPKGERVKFLPALTQSLRSRAFGILISLTVLKVIAGMLASSLDYYLIVYYMFDGDIAVGSFWKAWLSTGYAVVGFISVFVIGCMAARMEKRTVLAIIYLMVALGGVVKWFVFTPGQPWMILIDPIFCGPIWVAIGMIMPSMLADICDEDELKSGQRREGTYGAIFSWIQKTGVSLAFFGTGLALVFAGFDEQLGGDQPDATILAMRLTLTGAVVATSAMSAALLLFYPITRETAAATRRLLEERRGVATAE